MLVVLSGYQFRWLGFKDMFANIPAEDLDDPTWNWIKHGHSDNKKSRSQNGKD